MNAQQGRVNSEQINKGKILLCKWFFWGFFLFFFLFFFLKKNAVNVANTNICDCFLRCIQLKSLRHSVLSCFLIALCLLPYYETVCKLQ